jgi:L-fuconolactonase
MSDPSPRHPPKLSTPLLPTLRSRLIDLGADRSMFESNFPVDKVSCNYPIFWNACKLLTKGASSAEKTALFFGTATRFYRLNAMG